MENLRKTISLMYTESVFESKKNEKETFGPVFVAKKKGYLLSKSRLDKINESLRNENR